MSREHPLALHRLIPGVVIAVLGVAALLALKGPGWYQRFYHPLKYESAIAQGSRELGLDPYLVAALINVESGFDAAEVSDKGAVGLMQLLPSTAGEVSQDHGLGAITDAEALKDPETNIRIGLLHLRDLAERYSTLEEALAAYNAGSGNVDRWRGRAKASGTPFRDTIEYPETRQYLANVIEQREIYLRLYPEAFKETAR